MEGSNEGHTELRGRFNLFQMKEDLLDAQELLCEEKFWRTW